MTRRTAVFAVALLIAAGCQKADKRVTRANFDSIKSGMSLSEVEGMLGAGTEVTGSEGMGSGAAAVGVTGDLGSQSSGRPALRSFRWGTDSTHILVLINRADKVHDGPTFKSEKGLK